MEPAVPEPPAPTLLAKGAVGGVLMGLANLVPGISGGTMLLASGVYTRFVTAVAEVTTFRFRARSLLLLAAVGLAAVAAIVLLAGPVKHLVETRRWIMYSLFIGLTLGGVPLVWRRAKPGGAEFGAVAAVGFLVMAVMAFAQMGGAGAGGTLLLFVAGVAGAAAMVLPGVSGAYLLLVLGQYEPILGAVDGLKTGALAFGDAAAVLAPVAVGVAVGIAGVSNLVRIALARRPQATLGGLMGLLLGSVLGIWPFETAPTVPQAAGAVGLAAAGYLVTRAVDRLGGGADA